MKLKKEKHKILRTSLPLFSTSFVAQGINFLLLFLLPFLYSTQDVGQFFVFSAIGLLLGPLVSWSSFNAILLSDSGVFAKLNLGVSLVLGGATSFLLLLLLSLFVSWDLGDFSFEGLLLLPAFVLLDSSIISFENYLNYQKKYIKIGFIKLIKAVVTFVLTVFLGLVYPGFYSIVFAFLGGQLVAVISQFIFSRVTFHVFLVSRKKIQLFINKYRDILLYNSLMAVVSKLIIHSPIILLSLFYGERVVAFFGMAQRIFSTPLGLLVGSVSIVFGKSCVEKFHNNQVISGYFLSTLKKILWLFVPYGIIAFVFAPWIFGVVLGEEWEPGGTVARVILPLSVIQNTIMPFTGLNTILNFQKRIFVFYLISFAVRVGLLFVLPYLLFDINYLYLLALFTFSGFLHYVVYFYEIDRQINAYETKI